jgi:hypothetical protein
MREFVVTLRCGLKFVVKADKVVLLDRQFLSLVVTHPGSSGEPEDAIDETVALFERGQVAAVVARDHLVSEERCDPIPGRYVADDGSDIPF